MKVLLDHDLPRKLRLELRGHLVMTARQMKWDGLSNGRLLAAAEAAGFDVLITGDQSNVLAAAAYPAHDCHRGPDRNNDAQVVPGA